MTYQLLGLDGLTYGPYDLASLQAWAHLSPHPH